MKGSIWKQGKRFIVGFYYNGVQYKISRYKGETMLHRRYAEKCLAMIQGDYENYEAGLGAFRIEKYTNKGWTDVIEYYEEWLSLKKKKKPATYKGYKTYLNCHFKPFFTKHPVMLHEIQLDTLYKLLNSLKAVKPRATENNRCPECNSTLISNEYDLFSCPECGWAEKPLSPKMKYNIMNAFHAFLDHALRSRRIAEMPSFPKKEDYNLAEPAFEWLPEDYQLELIDQIPDIHRPIFLWLKYHYRRPAEACTLQWQDWDDINAVFVIRRSISARTVVESTKTGAVHYQPCDPDFLPIVRYLRKEHLKNDGKPTDFIFRNPRARRLNKRYTNESLNTVWKEACKKMGINISLYHGTKHSSCTQFVNDKGGMLDELQLLTDHARRESVLKYVRVAASRKLKLMKERRLSVVTTTNSATTKLPRVKNE